MIQYVGDGYCDDSNNYADCSYDLGDCCLENIMTDYCSICECIEGNIIINEYLGGIQIIVITYLSLSSK